MVQMAVTNIPQNYILERWTWDVNAALSDPTIEAHVREHQMPEESRRQIRFATMSSEFTKIAREVSISDDAQRIATSHMKAMKAELMSLKRREQRKARIAVSNVAVPRDAADASDPNTPPTAAPTPSAAPATIVEDSQASNSRPIRDPPRSTTKGRSKEKTHKHPLDIAPKKRRKCKFCNLTDHDGRNCPTRFA